MKRALAAAALVLSSPAFACGTCAEDKVAATYDHAVVQQAQRAGRVVVFCDVQGAFRPDSLASAARRLRGVDPASVRVSREPAAISFALDTRRQGVDAALKSLQRGAGGARVALVRVGPAG